MGSVTDVTDDGTRALYLRSLSDTEHILFTIDLATGKLTRLFPPEGQVSAIGDASFTPDGASVITASEALRRRRVPVEYMLIANEGHGVTRRENIIAYLARSYRFLADHMALPPANVGPVPR